MYCHLLLLNVLDCVNSMVNLTNGKQYSENIIQIKRIILIGVQCVHICTYSIYDNKHINIVKD